MDHCRHNLPTVIGFPKRIGFPQPFQFLPTGRMSDPADTHQSYVSAHLFDLQIGQLAASVAAGLEGLELRYSPRLPAIR